MPKKTQIEDAVNTYIGNYCYRKCFNHDSIMCECLKKFEEFTKKIGDTPISRKEFNHLMKNNEIKICKLPFKKRVMYVSWKYFEMLNRKNKDFWDME